MRPRSTSASVSRESTRSSDGRAPPRRGSGSAGFARSEPRISPTWRRWMQSTSVRTDTYCSLGLRRNFPGRSWWPCPGAGCADSSSEVRVATRAKSVRGSLSPDSVASRRTSAAPSSIRPVPRRSRSVVLPGTERCWSSCAKPGSRKCFVRFECGGEPTNFPETPPPSGPSGAWRKAEGNSLLLTRHDGEACPRPPRDAHRAHRRAAHLVNALDIGRSNLSLSQVLNAGIAALLGIAILVGSLLIYRGKYSSGGIINILLGIVALILAVSTTGSILAIVSGVIGLVATEAGHP